MLVVSIRLRLAGILAEGAQSTEQGDKHRFGKDAGTETSVPMACCSSQNSLKDATFAGGCKRQPILLIPNKWTPPITPIPGAIKQ